MVRQYRIDRVNGLEVLVCEVFYRHILTQAENDAYFKWKEHQRDLRPDISEEHLKVADFRADLDEALHDEECSQYFGLDYSIPDYNTVPSLIIRGPVVDNRIGCLQIDYDGSVLPPVVVDEVNRFYGLMDSRHWRDAVAHQLSRYGSLFASADD